MGPKRFESRRATGKTGGKIHGKNEWRWENHGTFIDKYGKSMGNVGNAKIIGLSLAYVMKKQQLAGVIDPI